jgi:hypothetical protein
MPIAPIPASAVRQATCHPQSFLDITTGEDEFMASSGKAKTKQQLVLAATVVKILAELHQLVATNARPALTENRTGSVGAPAMLIRGK